MRADGGTVLGALFNAVAGILNRFMSFWRPRW